MTTELTKAAQKNGPEVELCEQMQRAQHRVRLLKPDDFDAPELDLSDSHTALFALAEYWKGKHDKLKALTQRPAAQTEREAWVPYLVDRADGVKGHYAIGRWNPRGYREVWNLHSHRWAAYSDDVMSLEEADSLLRQITIPTARASLPAPQQATPALQSVCRYISDVLAGDASSGEKHIARTIMHLLPLEQAVSAQQATSAQEPHPLAAHCYTMSEPHLSGYRLVLGFETMEAVNAAQTWVANINKGTQQATPEPVGEHVNEPRVIYAGVRDADEELHIECRFDDGQKFAAVTVAKGFDNLAHRIEAMLNDTSQDKPGPSGGLLGYVKDEDIAKTKRAGQIYTIATVWSHIAPSREGYTAIYTRPAAAPAGMALVPMKATPKVAMVLYEGARNCFSPKVAEGLWQDALAAAQAKGAA